METATNTPTETATATATATNTPVPCSVTVRLTPASGIRLPQDLLLTAEGNDTCSRTLHYRWDCSSPNTQKCGAFLAQFTNPTQSSGILVLGEAEVFNVFVTALAVDGNGNVLATSMTDSAQYEGDEVS